MFAGILSNIALSFAGTLIDKVINGLLRYFERAASIKEAKELGASDQELEQMKATAGAVAANQVGQDAVDNMSEQEIEDLLTKP